MKKLPTGARHPTPASDDATDDAIDAPKTTGTTGANVGTGAHATLAGKVLQVFRVGGDSERSVGRHGRPPAEPEARRTGPVQQQAIIDGSGPVLARAMADSAPAAAAAPAPLSEARLGPGPQTAEAATTPAAPETIRVQTFSIDLAERLARTRAAQQQVLRELDQFDESGESLGKTVDRKR